MDKKRIAIVAVVLAIIAAIIGVSVASSANAAVTEPEPCVPAWTEVIEHPEVSHTVEHPAVTHEETVIDSPAIWANWEPNNTQGPQDYTPIWPSDERGHWTLHTQGIPPGHAGPDGVYQQGAGNSPWFYRANEVSHTVTVVDEEAWTETVIDEEAWTETIEHPQTGDCDENPPTPVQFSAPADPTPPTCDTAGSFSLPGNTDIIEWTIDPEYTGPGTYTVTATLVLPGYIWDDAEGESLSRSVEITVDPATGVTQSENPEGACYLAPEDPEDPEEPNEPEEPTEPNEPNEPNQPNTPNTPVTPPTTDVPTSIDAGL